jgi:hypothetical protein
LYTSVRKRICEIGTLKAIGTESKNILEQLPDLQIIDSHNDIKNSNKQTHSYMTFDEWADENKFPRVTSDCDYSDEENGRYYWDLHEISRIY